MIHREQEPTPLELSDLITDPQELLLDVFNQLEILGIKIEGFEPDHIGYRADSAGEYERICTKLRENGLAQPASKNAESNVRGRRITVFTLTQPINFNGEFIYYLEVIEPKPGDTRTFSHKLEHVEFVTHHMSLEEFEERYRHLGLNTSDMGRENNPEITITLKSGRTIGFHTTALVEYIDSQHR
jgi:predicted metalloenzyme YecM